MTKQMTSKMDEWRKWKNVKNEEGRKNYRRMRNKLKTATKKVKKEYLKTICDKSIELQITGSYDLMYIKRKEPGWKENQGIQNIDVNDSEGNTKVDQRHVLTMLGNYITELCDQANRPEELEVETEEDVDEDKKGPYILHQGNEG